MMNTMYMIFITVIVSITYSTDGFYQNSNDHVQNTKKTKQSELKIFWSEYAKAVIAKDTIAIYDNAYELMLYHNNNGNYDSTYYYNEVLIKTALYANDVNVYIDAQNNNYFMDAKIYHNLAKSEIRIPLIRSYLNHKNLKTQGKFDVAEILSTHFFLAGNIDSTLHFQQLAVDISEKIGTSHKVYVGARIQMAIYLNMVDRSAEAIQYLTDVEATFSMNPPSTMNKINFYQTMCASLLEIKETKITESYLAKMEDLVTQNNYKSFDNKIYFLKAKLANLKGDYTQSISHYKSAIKTFNKNGIKIDKPSIWVDISHTYYNLGDINNMKRYKDSLFTQYENLTERNKMKYHGLNVLYQLENKNIVEAKISLDYVNQYNTKPTPERLQIAKLNYLYYQNTSNLPKELEAYKSYVSLKDSLKTLSNIALARRIESEYNREKQDIEIDALTETTAAQDKAIAVRNNAIFMGSIMLFILACLLYGLYRLYKQNQLQTLRITKALEDNQMLIKEIHHRVKNNLQVVSSLLSMQARKIEDGDMKQALNSSMTRVQSMSILHQNLYSGTNPKDVDVDAYFDKLVENILSTYSIDKDVKFDVDIDNMAFDIDVMVPLGLIANELITNALKYAFAGRPEGKLSVSLKEKGNQIVLCVADDGIGFDGNELPKREGSIGTRLIKSFTKKLKGAISITHVKGTEITIVFDKEVLNGKS